MLSSSLFVLLAASSFVNSLPTWNRRQIPGVAAISGLGALTGTLGNTPSLDALANIPGAANPVHNAAVAPHASDKKDKGKKKGEKKKGKKHANANTGLANSTAIAGETGANSTATATEALGNATATGDLGAGNATVTVTVTVTETAGAANTTTAGDAGATSNVTTAVAGTTSDSLSATLTSPPVASTSSVSDVAGGGQ